VIVYAATVAALYVVMVTLLHPLSFGPLQLRLANVLKPLVLIHPAFALGFGLGTFVANLSSPFGPLDFVIMPLVDVASGLLAWKLRRLPVLGLFLQSLFISAAVSFFPLQMGGGVPFWATFPAVLLSNAVIILGGWFGIWRQIAPALRREGE